MYQYKDKLLTLTQEPHVDVPLFVNYQWMAHAVDDEGNEYVVTWVEYDNFDETDSSNACDWDKYEVFLCD